MGMCSSLDGLYDVSISWNYILLSVTDNFGLGKWAELKETTVNYFVLRHHWSIETWEQWVRIVWASLTYSLEVAKYDCSVNNSEPESIDPTLVSLISWIVVLVFVREFDPGLRDRKW